MLPSTRFVQKGACESEAALASARVPKPGGRKHVFLPSARFVQTGVCDSGRGSHQQPLHLAFAHDVFYTNACDAWRSSVLKRRPVDRDQASACSSFSLRTSWSKYAGPSNMRIAQEFRCEHPSKFPLNSTYSPVFEPFQGRAFITPASLRAPPKFFLPRVGFHHPSDAPGVPEHEGTWIP